MKKKRILMVAAENDGLSGGKVGGIGDVVRDVPVALAQQRWKVDVITPSYGFLHKSVGSRLIRTVRTSFGCKTTHCDIYSVPGKRSQNGLQHLVIDHPTFLWCDRGLPQIYRNDPPERPFASDASKYALFCRAVADAILQRAIQLPGCIHLHDWHAAFFLILRKYDETCRPLLDIPTVYTIHNLALRGVRPVAGDSSSLEAWFPDLALDLASAPDLLAFVPGCR